LAGRAIALLGDDDLDDTLVLPWFVAIGPVQHEDGIRILLKRVVWYQISGNEVGRPRNGQIIHLFLTVRMNGADFVPVDVADCEGTQHLILPDGCGNRGPTLL